MPAPYPLDKKMEILEYARAHGVMAAARKYGVHRQLITTWNTELHVYPVKTAEYPTELRMEIIRYSDAHGIRAAVRKYNVASGSIDRWRHEMNMFKPHFRTMTDEQKIEILEYARDYGVMRASEKFDVESDIMNGWNKTFKIYTEQTRQYDEGFIMDVLKYAANNGVVAASLNFNIPKGTITRWNASRHVFVPRVRPETTPYTPDQQLELLQRAHAMMAGAPDVYKSARSVFMELSGMVDVTPDQLMAWNKKFKVVPTRPRRNPEISQSQIAEIQSALNASQGSMAAAARRAHVNESLVRQLMQDKKISFHIASDKIKTGVPVGPKKSAAIRSIIQSLLQKKSH